MQHVISSLPAQAVPLPAVGVDGAFDARWTTWQMRGAAHERAARARLLVAMPIIGICAAAALYFMAR